MFLLTLVGVIFQAEKTSGENKPNNNLVIRGNDTLGDERNEEHGIAAESDVFVLGPPHPALRATRRLSRTSSALN